MKEQQAEGRTFTVYGKAVKVPQTSIHPRVVNGRTAHPKVNTAAAPRKK